MQDPVLMIFRIHLYTSLLLDYVFVFIFFLLLSYVSISVVNLIGLTGVISSLSKFLIIVPPVYRFFLIVGIAMHQRSYANLGIRVRARQGGYPQKRLFLFPWQD